MQRKSFKRKKGVIRTLEGALSLFILFTFILYILPNIPKTSENITKSEINSVMHSLENLKKAGILESCIYENSTNMTHLRKELSKTIPTPINFSITISKTKIETGTIISEDQNQGTNITYEANTTSMNSINIILFMKNATNPKIYSQSNLIYINPNEQPYEPIKLDLTTYTKNSTNTIEIKTDTKATIEYIILKENIIQDSQLNENKNTYIATYIITKGIYELIPSKIQLSLWKE